MLYGLVLTMCALVAYGLSRLAFNLLTLHGAGPSLLGDISATIGFHTLIALVFVQPVGALIQRFVPRYLAEANRRHAVRLFRRGLLATAGISLAITIPLFVFRGAFVARLGISRESVYVGALPYLTLFGLYSYLKMAYYAFGRARQYFIAEIAASGMFLLLAAVAPYLGGELAYVLPWIVHPVVFSAIAIVHLGPDLRISEETGSEAVSVRGYVEYGLAWLTTSAAGLGAYQLSIVLTSHYLADPVAVGHYSLLLSLLTPLNLLPLSLSMVLFPRMTANYAVRRGQANSRLIAVSTAGLLLAMAAFLSVVAVGARWILSWAGVVPDPTLVAAFEIVSLGVAISLVGTPAGNFLASSDFYKLSAVIGTVSLILGLLVWWLLLPGLGLVGSAIGLGVVMCARGAVTMVFANRHQPWWRTEGWRLSLLIAVLFVSVLLGERTASPAATVALLLCSLGAVFFVLAKEIVLLRQAWLGGA